MYYDENMQHEDVSINDAPYTTDVEVIDGLPSVNDEIPMADARVLIGNDPEAEVNCVVGNEPEYVDNDCMCENDINGDSNFAEGNG